jgi:hypothetical protein
MNQQNIAILEAQRPRVEYFFKSGSLILSNSMASAPCEKCIDTIALVRIMREEFEPGANINEYADWDEPQGYAGFLSRLYAHYDAYKKNNPSDETEGFNTIQQAHC